MVAKVGVAGRRVCLKGKGIAAQVMRAGLKDLAMEHSMQIDYS